MARQQRGILWLDTRKVGSRTSLLSKLSICGPADDIAGTKDPDSAARARDGGRGRETRLGSAVTVGTGPSSPRSPRSLLQSRQPLVRLRTHSLRSLLPRPSVTVMMRPYEMDEGRRKNVRAPARHSSASSFGALRFGSGGTSTWREIRSREGPRSGRACPRCRLIHSTHYTETSQTLSRVPGFTMHGRIALYSALMILSRFTCTASCKNVTLDQDSGIVIQEPHPTSHLQPRPVHCTPRRWITFRNGWNGQGL